MFRSVNAACFVDMHMTRGMKQRKAARQMSPEPKTIMLTMLMYLILPKLLVSYNNLKIQPIVLFALFCAFNLLFLQPLGYHVDKSFQNINFCSNILLRVAEIPNDGKVYR